jgi:hypothetical protein
MGVCNRIANLLTSLTAFCLFVRLIDLLGVLVSLTQAD